MFVEICSFQREVDERFFNIRVDSDLFDPIPLGKAVSIINHMDGVRLPFEDWLFRSCSCCTSTGSLYLIDDQGHFAWITNEEIIGLILFFVVYTKIMVSTFGEFYLRNRPFELFLLGVILSLLDFLPTGSQQQEG